MEWIQSRHLMGFKLPVADASLSVQIHLLNQVKPLADATDFLGGLVEQARLKSGRKYAEAYLMLL